MGILKKILPGLLVFALCLTGCGKQDNGLVDNSDGTNKNTSNVDFAENDEEMFTNRDKKSDYSQSSAVKIQLKDSTATASSDAVEISGTTIKITEEATYIIEGSLNDGMIVVDAPESAKLQIVLNGVKITSKSSAPLYIKEADKVVVTLADGTENSFENAGEFIAIDDNNIDGAVFSKQDLSFNGKGSLTVTSPAGHGIVCKDDLVFTGGTYTICSSGHAIDANDSVRAINTTINADSGKDGIHVENNDDTALGFVYISSGTYTMEAEGDGISAGSYIQINNGTFDITAGGGSENGTKKNSGNYGDFMGGNPPGGMGGERPPRPGNRTYEQSTTVDTEGSSMKAIKSTSDMLISGGTFKINSADDAIHSNASMYIKNAVLEAATGDDGIHAEDTLEITGGTMHISESYEGLEALHIKVSGGEITLTASDDGLNAAGGTDQSGFGGRDDAAFNGGDMGNRQESKGNRPGAIGGHPGGMSAGNGSIILSGGMLNITASGDGIDANGTLEITGGYITICGPTKGDTATLDFDKTATISGGTFIGTGASGMAQTFSDSKQGVIAVNVGTAMAANTEIILKDASGKTVLTHKPALDFSLVIISSPDIEKGETYTITVGTQTKEFQAS
ncbi:MAG: carbohydrate-binding domain-containing protein [Agathobacter sp.]|nr:carbohydrate-binding domain-containing protein [Lachnospiraceae bacterium]MBR3812121.1 carbohydrate-binding domain-containing protein [Agathobacter sp.]